MPWVYTGHVRNTACFGDAAFDFQFSFLICFSFIQTIPGHGGVRGPSGFTLALYSLVLRSHIHESR